MFNATSLSSGLLDSSNRTCWGLSGPADPSIETCIACEDKMETFTASETVYLQPHERVDGTDTHFDGRCDGVENWNLTGGADGSEVWRLDNSCASLALSSSEYKNVEFKGSFENTNDDDDWIGFVFGYQDPGHFFIVLAPGDWLSHVASK